MIINLDCEFEGDATFALVAQLRDIIGQYYDDYHFAGESISTYDLKETVTADMLKVNFIAISAIMLVLLLSLKSLLLPIILVAVIEASIWINLSFPYFMDDKIFYIAYLIISSIQLGATVDYAILMTTNYLEQRVLLPKKQALHQTMMNSILPNNVPLTTAFSQAR